MNTLKELTDLVHECCDCQAPQLVKIIPQVRTGTSYPLPPWFNPATPCQGAKPSKS